MEQTQFTGQPIPVVFISDDGYVMPTCVAIQSLVQSKRPDTVYEIHIVCASLTEESQNIFRRFESDTVHIRIIQQSAERFADLHVFREDSFCVATPAALLKLVLPELLCEYDKVLYLDGDLLVREDLTSLYATELGDAYLAAVTDSGCLYSRNKFISQVEQYFNSGVMLLNLEQMRLDALPEKLIRTKAELQDSSLMDQNVLNLVCSGRTVALPIRYNFLPINLLRAEENWTLEQLNSLYGTAYPDKASLFADGAILHFSSKDKPWKVDTVAFADDWYRCYYAAPIDHPLRRSHALPALTDCPRLSVILSADAPEESQEQSLKEIELLWGEDALTRARGQFLWFGRDFTLEDAEVLALCWETALENGLDAVLVDTEKCRKTNVYLTVCTGQALYAQLMRNGDFNPNLSGALYRREYLQTIPRTGDPEVFTTLALIRADRVRALNAAVSCSSPDASTAPREPVRCLMAALSRESLEPDARHAAAMHLCRLMERSGITAEDEDGRLLPILQLHTAANFPSETEKSPQLRAERKQLLDEKALRWEELQGLYKEKGQRWQELQALKKEKGERWQELQALKKEKAERWQELQALKQENAQLRKQLQTPPKTGISPDGTAIFRLPPRLARLMHRIAAKFRKGV